MHGAVVTGTGADMLSQCDEKHSEMMRRECSYCPQRDGRQAVFFVQAFVRSVRFVAVYLVILSLLCLLFTLFCVVLLPFYVSDAASAAPECLGGLGNS